MDVSAWQDWIGRTESRSDSVDPAPLARWPATLDRDPTADGTARQGFHWCLALPDAPTNALGADGHPRREASPASYLPPIPLPRRMSAPRQIGSPPGRERVCQSV